MAEGLTAIKISPKAALPADYDRFAVLDGLRGIGAVIVVIGHGLGDLRSGYPAVDFFFLHSGFVLAYSNWRRRELPRFGIEFAVRRTIRIYPLYMIGIGLGLIEAIHLMTAGDPLWSPHRTLFAVVTSLFLIPDPWGGINGVFPINQPGWSLFFELAINYLFCVVRFRFRPSLLICLASLPLLCWSYHTWLDGGGSNPGDFLGGFPRIGYSFCMGVLIFHALKAGRIPKMNVPWWACWLALPLLYAPASGSNNLYIALLTIVIQPLLAMVLTNARISGRARKFALWLGLVSYALYCVHMPLQLLCSEALAALRIMTPAHADTYAWFISAPLSLLLAHILTLYVDVPMRTYLNERWASISGNAGPIVPVLQTPSRTAAP